MPKKKKPKEVGKSYPEPKVFTYSRCKPEKNGWIDPNKYLPLTYDLVILKIKRNKKISRKEFSGWWNGGLWDGPHITSTDEIVYWKREEEKK